MKRFPRLRKFLLRGFLVLLVLLLAGWAFENWRGAKAWEEAQARAEKAGVSLVRADYAGPEIPDEENLLMDPVFLKELEDEGVDKLTGWGGLPEFSRKRSRFSQPATGEPAKYADYFDEALTEQEAQARFAEAAEDFEARLDVLAGVILSKPQHAIFAQSASVKPLIEFGREVTSLNSISACLGSSALMAIRSGDSQKAMERLELRARLGRAAEKPSLLHCLFGNAASIRNDLIWEGLRLRVWSNADLGLLQDKLEERNLSESFGNALRFEAAFGVEGLDHSDDLLKELQKQGDGMSYGERFEFWLAYEGPAGWQGRRKAFVVNRYLDVIDAVEAGTKLDEAKLAKSFPTGKWSPLQEMAVLVQGVSNLYTGLYEIPETERRIALIAIALERYFLVHQSYPGSLAEFKLETPVIDLSDPKRRDLIYQLGPDGRPVIFSEYEEETEKRISRRKLRWQFYEAVKKVVKSSPEKRGRGR